MKKLILSITVLCYLALTSGVIVNFHYCMNRLASTEFYATESKECARCGMDIHTSNGCCHDEVKIIKMETDQKVTPALSFELPPLDAMVTEPSAFIVASFINSDGQRHFHNHSPPLLAADICVENCVFRI